MASQNIYDKIISELILNAGGYDLNEEDGSTGAQITIWAPNTEYFENKSIVIHNNALWLAKENHISSTEFDETKWTNLTSATATTVRLTNDLIVTNPTGDLHGTIPAGTSVEELWNLAHAPYVRPSFNKFTIAPKPTMEVGQDYTITSATWGWTKDNLGTEPSNIFITGVGYDPDVDRTLTPNVAPDVPSELPYRRTTPGSLSYTVRSVDVKGAAVTRSDSVSWRDAFVFGVTQGTPANDTEASTILNQSTRSLKNSRAHTFTTTSESNELTNNTFFAYPAKYGNVVEIKLNGAYTITPTFIKHTFNITNNHGVTISYNMYISSQVQAYSAGDNIAVK